MVLGCEGAAASTVYHIFGSERTIDQLLAPLALGFRKTAYCKLPVGWQTAKTVSVAWPGCTMVSKQPLVVPPVRVAAGPPSGDGSERFHVAPLSRLVHSPLLVAA